MKKSIIRKYLQSTLILGMLIVLNVSASNAQDKAPNLDTQEQAFFRKNKTEKGVTETASGLQYKIEIKGTGVKPLKFSRVRINFTLRNLNGKIIGSNGNNTWEHHLDKASYGMQEALKMMPAGSKWILYMPRKLCLSKYEDWGFGRCVMCTLELISVNE